MRDRLQGIERIRLGSYAIQDTTGQSRGVGFRRRIGAVDTDGREGPMDDNGGSNRAGTGYGQAGLDFNG